ncbi:MAG: hypothetical protein ACP5LE_06740 [Thermoplasmata archaeon]
MARNKVAMGLGIGGGICLVSAGTTGVGYLGTIRNIILQIINNDVIALLFTYLIAIAALGGIAVIIGAILIGLEHPKIGKIFVWLGVGMGIISLIFALISLYSAQEFATITPTALTIIGTALATVSRYIAK